MQRGHQDKHEDDAFRQTRTSSWQYSGCLARGTYIEGCRHEMTIRCNGSLDTHLTSCISCRRAQYVLTATWQPVDCARPTRLAKLTLHDLKESTYIQPF